MIGLPDWVPIVGGTELFGPIPEIGIVAAFVITIPIAIVLLGYLFKVSLVDRLLTPGGDDIPLVIATIGLALVIREYLRVEFGATPRAVPLGVRHRGVAPGRDRHLRRRRRDPRRQHDRDPRPATVPAPDLDRPADGGGGAEPVDGEGPRHPGRADGPVHVRDQRRARGRSPPCSCRRPPTSGGTAASPSACWRSRRRSSAASTRFAAPCSADFLVGVSQNWSGYYLSSAYRDAIPLILLILVILWRPQGLFGIAEERTV